MALEKFQYGVESRLAPGTAVAADTMIVGAVTMPFVLDRKPTIPPDDIGLKVGGYRAVQTSGKLVTNKLSIARGYFQILPLLFSLTLKGGVTAVEQTTDQDDYLWDFTPDLDDDNVPDSATFEHGDSVQAFEEEYATGEQLSISGTIPQDGGDAPVKVEMDYFARQQSKTTFTSGLTPPVVDEMNSVLTRLFIDDLWADAGETEKTGILRAYDFSLMSGNQPAFHGGSSPLFDKVDEGKIAVACNLTLDNGDDAMDLYDAIGTMKVIKLLLEGPAIGTGKKHSLALAFSGMVMEPIPGASKQNETSLATVRFEGVYGVTGAKLVVPQVITNVASI